MKQRIYHTGWLHLASILHLDNGYAFFGLQCIFNDFVSMYDTLYSDGGPSGVYQYYGVRPVVSLKSNVQIGEKEGEIWTLK